MPGLDVTLRPLHGSWRAEGSGSSEGTVDRFPTTDHEGRVCFRASAGEHALEVLREGALPSKTEVTLETGESREIELELPTGNDLLYHGRVVLRGGGPIAGAEVLLFEPWESSSGSGPRLRAAEVRAELARTTSDARGHFQLWIPSWRAISLRIGALGFTTVDWNPGAGHESQSSAELVRLGRCTTLEVTVLDQGQVVPGAEVSLEFDTPSGLAFHAGLTTDAEGRCRFMNLPVRRPLRARLSRPRPPRPFQVSGPDPEYERYLDPREREILLEPDEVREVTWSLGVRCVLEGTVRDENGAPIPGLSLYVGRRNGSPSGEGANALRPLDQNHMDRLSSGGFGAAYGKTDEHGHYAFPPLPSGDWWFGPTPRGLMLASPENDRVPPYLRHVSIPEGCASRSLDLVVTRDLVIRGRVVGPEGEPIQAIVRLERGMSTRSGCDGRFELGPLEPGEYSLHVLCDGLYLDAPVLARTGDEDVQILLERSATIRGRVIDAATGLPCRARIRTFLEGRRPSSGWGQSTDASGAFELHRPGRRTTCVQAHTPDGRIAWNSGVLPGPGGLVDGLVLSLVPGARLRVRHEGDPALRSVSVHVAGVPVASDELDAGKETVLVVPAGPCRVVFEDLEGTREEVLAVTTRTGTETECVLRDGPGTHH